MAGGAGRKGQDRDPGRRRAYRLGLSAETIAAWALRLKGYHILARRFRVPTGEIDLIARRGNVVAFIEVKARADLMAGLEAVTPAARRRITRAADLFMAGRPDLGRCGWRYDIIVVRPRAWPAHVVDAFRPEA